MGISFSQSTYSIWEGQNEVVVCLEANATLPEAVQAVLMAAELQNATGKLLFVEYIESSFPLQALDKKKLL